MCSPGALPTQRHFTRHDRKLPCRLGRRQRSARRPPLSLRHGTPEARNGSFCRSREHRRQICGHSRKFGRRVSKERAHLHNGRPKHRVRRHPRTVNGDEHAPEVFDDYCVPCRRDDRYLTIGPTRPFLKLRNLRERPPLRPLWMLPRRPSKRSREERAETEPCHLCSQSLSPPWRALIFRSEAASTRSRSRPTGAFLQLQSRRASGRMLARP